VGKLQLESVHLCICADASRDDPVTLSASRVSHLRLGSAATWPVGQ